MSCSWLTIPHVEHTLLCCSNVVLWLSFQICAREPPPPPERPCPVARQVHTKRRGTKSCSGNRSSDVSGGCHTLPPTFPSFHLWPTFSPGQFYAPLGPSSGVMFWGASPAQVHWSPLLVTPALRTPPRPAPFVILLQSHLRRAWALAEPLLAASTEHGSAVGSEGWRGPWPWLCLSCWGCPVRGSSERGEV